MYKILNYSIILITVSAAIVIGCENIETRQDSAPAAVEQIEIIDDAPEAGARVAVPIPKENKVYQCVKVITGPCSDTGSAQIAYIRSDAPNYSTYYNQAPQQYPDSMVTSAKNFKKFSLKVPGTWYKKAVDKTYRHVYLIRDKSAKVWRMCAEMDENLPVYGFINYYKQGLVFSCNGTSSEAAPMN
jgi:hypothetical protein